MEDLVPFLIFLVIVAINAIKFLAEKGRPAKSGKKPDEAPPKQRKASSLEEFFERLSEQVRPEPPEQPDWPADFERPDYAAEMEEYEQARTEEELEEQTAEIIPMPEIVPVEKRKAETPAFQPLETPGVVTAPMQTSRSILSGSQGMRMPCMNPFNHAATGHTEFRIKNKKQLRKAMLAHIVFSPPRAFDLSCDPLRQQR